MIWGRFVTERHGAIAGWPPPGGAPARLDRHGEALTAPARTRTSPRGAHGGRNLHGRAASVGPMKTFIGILLLVGFLSGCFVRTGPRHNSRRQESRASCPPSQHWNGWRCEHNGRKRGHDKRKNDRRR